MSYRDKYLKYKKKYIDLKNKLLGGNLDLQTLELPESEETNVELNKFCTGDPKYKYLDPYNYDRVNLRNSKLQNTIITSANNYDELLNKEFEIILDDSELLLTKETLIDKDNIYNIIKNKVNKINRKFNRKGFLLSLINPVNSGFILQIRISPIFKSTHLTNNIQLADSSMYEWQGFTDIESIKNSIFFTDPILINYLEFYIYTNNTHMRIFNCNYLYFKFNNKPDISYKRLFTYFEENKNDSWLRFKNPTVDFFIISSLNELINDFKKEYGTRYEEHYIISIDNILFYDRDTNKEIEIIDTCTSQNANNSNMISKIANNLMNLTDIEYESFIDLLFNKIYNIYVLNNVMMSIKNKNDIESFGKRLFITYDTDNDNDLNINIKKVILPILGIDSDNFQILTRCGFFKNLIIFLIYGMHFSYNSNLNTLLIYDNELNNYKKINFPEQKLKKDYLYTIDIRTVEWKENNELKSDGHVCVGYLDETNPNNFFIYSANIGINRISCLNISIKALERLFEFNNHLFDDMILNKKYEEFYNLYIDIFGPKSYWNLPYSVIPNTCYTTNPNSQFKYKAGQNIFKINICGNKLPPTPIFKNKSVPELKQSLDDLAYGPEEMEILDNLEKIVNILDKDTSNQLVNEELLSKMSPRTRRLKKLKNMY